MTTDRHLGSRVDTVLLRPYDFGHLLRLVKIRQATNDMPHDLHKPVGNACTSGLLAVLFAFGCSAPPAKQVVLKGTERTAESHFYPQSLRLAARARVQSRSGDNALAAEFFRAAYHVHPDIRHLLDYARATERGRFFNEARTAYQEALTHDLSEIERRRVTAEIERLETLVGKDQVPVTLQIRPRNARGLVSAAKNAADPRSVAYARVVMGDAKIYLRPGTYNIDVRLKGYRQVFHSFRVKAGSGASSQGQLLGVNLRPDEKIALAVAQHAHLGEKRRPTKVKKPIEKLETGEEEPEDELADDEEPEEVADGGDDADDEPDAAVSGGGSGGGGGMSKWGPIATTGVGVLGLAGGGGLWWLALQEADSAQNVSPVAANKKEIFDFHAANAELYWNMRIVAFGVGGTLIAAGSIWMALAPKSVAVAPHKRGLADLLQPTDLNFDGRSFGATWRF